MDVILSENEGGRVERKTYVDSYHAYSSMDTPFYRCLSTVACHLAKGGQLNVIGKEITEIKDINELPAVVAADSKSIKGYVVYIDHFGNCVTNISKKLVKDAAKGREFEVTFSNKTIRGINKGYSYFTTRKATLKDYEGEKLAIFNEAGFLEIAIYRSNPSTVGTARSLLGLKFRDVVNVVFKAP